MHTKTPHVHAEVIKAWADGAEIEVGDEHGNWFKAAESLSWNPNVKYRVKPEPKPDHIFYAVASLEDRVHKFVGKVDCIGRFNGNVDNNLILIFDGETNKLKEAKVIRK
jgi:hypothetical protein